MTKTNISTPQKMIATEKKNGKSGSKSRKKPNPSEGIVLLVRIVSVVFHYFKQVVSIVDGFFFGVISIVIVCCIQAKGCSKPEAYCSSPLSGPKYKEKETREARLGLESMFRIIDPSPLLISAI